MFWQVRAVLEDRPGAMAALAGLCGEHDINILGLQIFPTAGGRVLDEFVLSTPEGWSAERIEELFSSSSVSVSTVVGCSVHVLEDQPVRYLRAARAVMDDPAALSEVLCGLLGAGSVEDAARRGTPFTDTEIARAAELRRFAGSAAESLGSVEDRAATGVQPALRRGSVSDAERIVAMHQRCSADALYRRYHAPTARTTLRLARRLLEPDNGWSVVAEVGERIVAIGMVAGDVAEVGLLVEDGWRRGLGSKILSSLVQEAASRGIAELTCLALTDSEAVPRMIHRAGLHARAGLVHGVVRYMVPVPTAGPAGRDLRPAAAFIDQAVRG